jgi:EAL domain-containing protein (putative c-di-GMP-specific phosphodiesterase class I)
MPPPVLAPDPAITALQEAVRRSVRGGAPRSVLWLFLSAPGLAAPNHASHHARVARAVMTDVAQRLDGEVLRLANGDLALVCRRRPGTPDAIGPDADGPEGLAAVLNRLFAVTAVKDAELFARWQLPRDAAALAARLADHKPPPAGAIPPASTPRDPLGTVGAMLDIAGVADVMRRQTAVRIDTAPGARRMRPAFQEVTVSITALESRIAAFGQAQSDPFVFRHMAARLDAPMMAALTRQIERRTPRTALDEHGSKVPVHINLALPGILSPALAELAQVCADHAQPLGIELSMIEASADLPRFAAAQARLETLGIPLVLDGVTPEALQITRLGALGTALLKLDWSPALVRLAGLARGRMLEALRAVGPARVVLHHAETEAALVWGREHDIALFQGRYVDAMLGAGRITQCAYAAGCTLRQCIDRAAAMEPPGRAGCRDHALLESAAAAPGPVRA